MITLNQEILQEQANTSMSKGSFIASKLSTEEWNEYIEEYLKEKIIKIQKRKHNLARASRKNQLLYYGFTIPSIVIPVIMSGISNYVDEENRYWIDIGFISVSIMNVLNTFLSFNVRKEKLSFHSSLYDILENEIETEMARNPKYRRDVDIFINEIRLRYDHLELSEPETSSCNCRN